MKPCPKLDKPNVVLNSPGGRVETAGSFIAPVSLHGVKYQLCFFVVLGMNNSLLSRSSATKLGLVQRIEEVRECVFGKTGLMNCDPVKIKLKENAEPYSLNVARRIPIPLLPKVKAEVERMEAAGVIEPVTQPTPWCAPIVPVSKKDGSVRICADLKKLNVAVQRERYVLPTLEDVIHKLSGATVFTTLDASSGYWAVPLHAESRLLTTFITPMGRYCFKRLPFGISCASEIFQRVMNDLLKGTGAIVWQDDILISGKTLEEHDRMLDEVMKRIEESGLKLNKAKCVFRKSCLRYVGHMFSKDGVSPDDSKVQAIVNLKPPENIAELRSVLGMVKYLGRYLPNLATVIAPMNELLCKNTEFKWGYVQDEAFKRIKQMICDSPVLAYYDVNKPTVVSSDASSYGIAGVIMQQHGEQLKPVAFCSRTLTNAERSYAQIEKECLAATWTCEKFRRYLQGLECFKLITDHKPLVPLMDTRDLDQVPVRCQRLLMRLMPFNLKAEHIPGKQLIVADMLSRQPMNENISNTEDEVAVHVNTVLQSKPMSDRKLAEIQSETKQDDELQKVIELTLTGWPQHRVDVPALAMEFYNVRHALSVSDGILLMGSRIVVPRRMRDMVLSKIHEGHMGINKSRERANMSVFWPGINGDIQKTIRDCEFCQVHRPSQKHEPLIVTPQPQRPWQKIAVDLCEVKKEKYMVMMDYFSKWIEILHMPDTTAGIIGKMKVVFATHGVVEEIVSDNGPPFDSRAMKQFADEYGILLTTVSPYNPQANGQAESGVAIAERILKQDDPVKALMIYRSTPVQSTGCSPSKLLMGRELRTTMPILPRNLSPQWPNMERVSNRVESSQQVYKRQYDRRHGVIPLPFLKVGDKVRMSGTKQWSEPATVVKQLDTPRSYVVESSAGKMYRRNRRDLQALPSAEQSLGQSGTLANETTRDVPTDISPSSKLHTRSGRLIKPTFWSKDYVL